MTFGRLSRLNPSLATPLLTPCHIQLELRQLVGASSAGLGPLPVAQQAAVRLLAGAAWGRAVRAVDLSGSRVAAGSECDVVRVWDASAAAEREQRAAAARSARRQRRAASADGVAPGFAPHAVAARA